MKLIEGIDFVLILSSDDNGHVRCGCRASSRLSKQGKNFQLSNYYRHLKTGVCPMLEAKQQQNNNNVNASNTASIQEETSTQQVTTIENTQMLAADSSRSTRSKRPSVSPGTNQLKKKRRRN